MALQSNAVVPWARFVGFVGLNVGLVAGFALLLWHGLPPLANEGPDLLFYPLTILAVPASALLHRVVSRCESSVRRAIWLYVTFVGVMIGYGLLFGVREIHRGETAFASLRFVPLALLMGHWFGAPAYVVIGLLNKLASPALCPRPSALLGGGDGPPLTAQ